MAGLVWPVAATSGSETDTAVALEGSLPREPVFFVGIDGLACLDQVTEGPDPVPDPVRLEERWVFGGWPAIEPGHEEFHSGFWGGLAGFIHRLVLCLLWWPLPHPWGHLPTSSL